MSAKPKPVDPRRNEQPTDKRPAAEPEAGIVLSPAEQRRRRSRNIAIALTLAALVILFYVMTLARLGSNVFDRPL
jgi:hypothetical protein